MFPSYFELKNLTNGQKVMGGYDVQEEEGGGGESVGKRVGG